MHLKKCTICKKIKPREQFGKSSSEEDGYRGQCKECKNKQHGEYQKRNRERLRSYLKIYMREYCRKKRLENPEFVMNGNRKLKKREKPYIDKIYVERVRWTENEIEILKSLYPTHGIKVRKYLFRSDGAIKQMRYRLGLCRAK